MPLAAPPPVRVVLWAGLVVFSGCKGDAPDPAPKATAPAASPSPPPAAKATSEQRYLKWRDRFESDPGFARGEAFADAEADLREVANEASDAHLRANAGILLGALYEEREAFDRAEAFYRLAAAAVPDDAGPHMALALALAKQGKYGEAVPVQERATEIDPDNLENWLALGELQLKAGDADASAQTYAGYEQRRKGLIDGLTLTREGVHMVGAEERVGCAEALAAAPDQGTAVALVYALEKDPAPAVRAAVARVMGIQRVGWYRPALQQRLSAETDPEVQEALRWALAEIERDPVEIAPEGAAKPTEVGDSSPAAEPAEPAEPVEPGEPVEPAEPAEPAEPG